MALPAVAEEGVAAEVAVLGKLNFSRISRSYMAAAVFIISLGAHLIGLNQVGRTWDEQFKVDLGYIGLRNYASGEFTEEAWSDGIEHPMIAKYIYGLTLPWGIVDATPPFTPSPDLAKQIQAGLWMPTQFFGRVYLVPYDFTAPRILSALFNSAAVTGTFVLALRFFPAGLALFAPVFLLLTPRFVAMGQLVTFESLSVFLFTLMAYCLAGKKYFWAALVAAFAFWSRYNNAYFYVFIAGFLLIHRPDKNDFKKLLWFPALAIGLGLLSWPFIWHSFPANLIRSFNENGSRGIGPSLYFLQSLAVTTPIPILLLSLLGFSKADKITGWWFSSVIFFFTFLSVPGGGTRYIFVIYPAMALLAVYGIKTILDCKRIPLPLLAFAGVASLVWLITGMSRYYPYYLDYYNETVGGARGAASRGYEVSWWGEGQREAALWLKSHAAEKDTVALYVTPKYVFPAVFWPRLTLLPYGQGIGEAKFLVISRPDLAQITVEQLSAYTPVYEAKVADSVPLVTVFMKK